MDRSGFSRLLKFLICFILALAVLSGALFCLKWCGGLLLDALFAENPQPTSPATETAPPETQAPTTEPTQPPTTAPTEPPQTEPTEPESEYIVAKATIAVTGDIMSHMPVVNAGYDGTEYNYDRYFAYVSDHVTEADFAVANLETTFAGTENGDVYSGFPKFNCPDAMADALKKAGFDMLLTANNHSYDTGTYGLNRTLEVIADRGMLSLGTMTSAEAPKYIVQDINGIQVGMICYTYGLINSSTGQKSVNVIPVSKDVTEQINVFDYEKLDRFYSEMENYIAAMKAEGAEAIVLFIHWGTEYQLQENSYQTEIAQKMCDLGVDVIAGGHPHVVQGVELLSGSENEAHKTLCVYSVGNAISNQRIAEMRLKTGHTEDGMLFSFTFARYTDGRVYLDSAEILPTWLYMHTEDGIKSYDILPLDRKIADWKAAFGLDDSNLENAEDSYERTLEQVGAGMEEAETYLTDSKAAREAEYAKSAG